MILSFLNQGTEDVFNGKNTKQARKICPASINRVAVRKLDQINAATILDDLRAPPNNRLESLAGDRLGQHSIRINDQYRICFIWSNSGASQVEIVDYH
ncbi:type II toxin-antitoxin system RelE/ParE family toxin [Pseudanabaena sp. BC1403]|jgi:proteic killer suppression protein|uniref:type II toxin-antitoxin system RelE/ParE family toxin n=1 Tax=Pseudanabaena sp. BC1403 TaxID=2043171 RepID=UPI000CD88EBC|nr:type II toxin-antitoxin system RelE/ParE family toxin [Pseudanabaena sp. BC1403]